MIRRALVLLAFAGAAQGQGTPAPAPTPEVKPMSVLSTTVQSIDGKPVNLQTYEGKVLLVVNTASQCGFTPQYSGLQKLYETYSPKGFVILGFPSNDFGAQEPGTDEEIHAFCSKNFGVTFPMFSKVAVLGDAKTPLYRALTSDAKAPGEVKWNFEKFLIGKDGTVAARFSSKTTPDDPLLLAAIDRELAK